MTRLRIAVLAYTSIARDMRVRRTAETLAAAGHEVTTIGHGPAPSDRHPHVGLQEPSPHEQRAAFLLTQFPANLAPALAPRLHLLRPAHRAARDALIRLKPDVIHANDWIALPAAAAAKRATGAKLVYDSHEFAAEEHADNLLWRIVAQRSAQETERRLIGEADFVVTVGEGIAEALQRLHGLSRRPSVILNAPPYRRVEPAALSHPRILLFHGVLKRGRGIEVAIAAMAHLPDHRLVIRGNGAAAYVDGLKRQAAGSGAAERIAFEPAVAPEKVVEAASSAHIGLFCAPMDTGQNRLAMPNKFFEYAMAGLAIVAAEGGELGRIVQARDCGVIAPCEPQAIAQTIRALDDATLARLRGNALKAALDLCWDNQARILLDLYESMATPSRSAGSAT